MTDARPVYFYAQIIEIGIGGGHLGQTGAIAKTNFHNQGRLTTKSHQHVKRLFRRQTVFMPVTFQRLLLSGRGATLTANKAADSGWIYFVRFRHGNYKNKPSIGEEAEAKRLRGMRPAR